MNKCYVCHYHLSGQAQEDLLNSHLPEGNKLSCSLYTFLTRTVNHTGMSKMHAYTYFEEFLVGVIAIMINM